MELGMISKRGAVYLLISLAFLLSLYVALVYALESDSVVFAGATPTNGSNVSGTITLQLNASNLVNFTNVTFSVLNRTGSLIQIGINFTQNQSRYFITWDTGNGNFRDDNMGYTIVANGTNVTGSSLNAVEAYVGTGANNITIDNTVPTVTYDDTAGSAFANPDATDYFNSTPVILAFNFSITDGTMRSMTGPCIVKIDFSNSTMGGNLTSVATQFANTSKFNLTTSLGAGYEGSHAYRVECRQDAGTNVTGNSTSRTIILDISAPTINMSFIDPLNNLASTSFGLGSEVLAKCSRGDSISGINHTEILLKAPYDQSFISKKVDDTLVPATSTASTEYTVQSEDTNSLGTYIVECRSIDRAGIILIRNSTFEVETQTPPSTSAYAVPGFKEPIAKTIIGVGGVADAGDLTADGVARLMAETAVVTININGQKHSFTVNEVGEGFVMLEVASEPFEVRINEGETKEVDVDADGLNDISVNLNMIYKNKADLVFNLLAEQTPAGPALAETGEEGDGITPESAEEGKFSWTTLFVIIILLILAAFLVMYFLRRRQQGGQDSSTGIKFTPKDLGMSREPGEETFGGYPYKAPPASQPTQPGKDQKPQRPFY